MSETGAQTDGTGDWPGLAVGRYERSTGGDAAVVYEFEDTAVVVPSTTDADAERAHWTVDGTLRVTTSERD